MSKDIKSILFRPFIDGYFDVENQLVEYIRNIAEEYFKKERKRKEAITSTEEFEEYRKSIKEYFIKSIGGLPRADDVPRAQIKGAIYKEGYRIEKVIL